MAGGGSDIELLAGLEGGGSLSGASGQNIKNQLDNIINAINKNPLEVKVKADEDSLRKFRNEIKELSNVAKKEAAEIRDALSGATKDTKGSKGASSGGKKDDIKRSAEDVEKYNKAIARTNTLLTQVRKARQSWTAAENGLAKDHYKDLGRQNTELELLVDQLQNYEISLEDFESKYAEIQKGFSTSKDRINLFGEDTSQLKKDTKAYRDALSEIDKLSTKYQSDYIAKWTAADGGDSDAEYQNLIAQADALSDLRAKVESGAMSLSEYRAELDLITGSAERSVNAIKSFGENVSKDSAEAISNKVRQATDEFARMERNLKKWTAAQTGESSDSYSQYLDETSKLEGYIAQLKAGEISLAQFNVLLAKVRENASEASAEIARMGENIKATEPIKPGSADQRSISDKVRKGIFNLEKDRDLWTAAGLDGAKSSSAYKSLDEIIIKLRNLDTELNKKHPTLSLDEAIEKYNSLISLADGYRRAIKRAGEDHGVEEKLTEGSKDYSTSLDQVQKKIHDLRKDQKEWAAAGLEGAASLESYKELEGIIALLEDLETNLKNKTLSEFKKELADLTQQANNASRKIEAAGEDHGVEEKLTKDAGNVKDYLASMKKVNDEIKSATANQKKWSAAKDGKDTSADYENIGKQIKELESLKQSLEDGKLTLSEFNAQFDKIKLSLSESGFKIESSNFAMTEAESLQKFEKQLKEVDAALEQNENNLKSWSRAKYGSGKDSFAGLEEVVADLRRMRDELLQTGHALDNFESRMSKASSSSAKFGSHIKSIDEDTMTLGDSVVGIFKEVGQYIDVMDVVFEGIEYGKRMVEAVTDIDTAMTELRKVTDETEASYASFLEDASGRAEQLGATVADVISSSADFARLGHDLQGASALADAALVYKNVGDGINDVEVASSSIISTMQAFGIEAKNAMSIVDSFNAVGNNFAISSAGIGDALLNSAASLAAAGNDIHESVALIAAANTTIQDPGRVGTALKTLSMYLRAAKTEAEDAGISTEGMAESVSQLRDELLALTGNKVDIMSNAEAGEYKSTVEILRDLSKVWDDLSDTSRTNITELIGGGVRNANIIASLMQNFDIVENAMQTSADSAGSALAENEKYLDSIVGKTAQFKAAFETLSTTFFDSDVIKGFVDAGTSLLTGANSLAKNFGPILLAFTGGRILDTITNLGDVLKNSEKFKQFKSVLDGLGLSGKGIAGGSKTTLLQIRPPYRGGNTERAGFTSKAI